MSDIKQENEPIGSRTDDLFMPDHTFPEVNVNSSDETKDFSSSNENHLVPAPVINAKIYNDESPYRNSQNAQIRKGNLGEVDTPVGPSHVDSISSMKLSSSFDQISGDKAENINKSDNQDNGSVPQVANPEEKKSEVNAAEDLGARIIKAKSFNDSAKFFVKGSLFNDAIKTYEASFASLKLTPRDHLDPNFKKGLQLQNDIFNNLSYCYGSLERYEESIAYARRVLFTDHDNIKALFRLAVGYKQTGNLLTAFDVIKKCKEVFKIQNPDQPLDSKIHELYASLRADCKEQLDEQERKEKEVYSKMLGTNKTTNAELEEKSVETNNQKTSPLAWRPVRYALYLGPTIILGVIAGKIIRQRSIEAAKNHIPAILTTIGAILCIRYLKNHVRKSVLGLGLATAAAIMVARTRGVSYWSSNRN